jgi:hypothetical protein
MAVAWIRRFFIGILVLVGACGDQQSTPSRGEATVGVQVEALTATQQRVLGFEGTIGGASGDWRALSGTATSNSTRVEGAKSLALSASQNPKAISIPLSALGPVASAAKISVSLPTSLTGQPWLGQLALTLDAPSAGVFNQYVGPVAFVGPVGSFREYTIQLPASIVTKLSASGYADLRITVELNVPSTSGSFLVDKLILTSSTGTGGAGGGTSSGGSAGQASGGTSGGQAGGGQGGGGGQSGGGQSGSGGIAGGGTSGGGSGGTSGGSAGSGGSGALTYEFFIRTPNGVAPEEVIVASDGFLKINDRVKLLEATGSVHASVSNVSGSTRAWFGPQAEVEDVWSKSGVELKNRAHVFGSIESESAVVREPDSIVDGVVSDHAELDPIESLSWFITFPSASQGNVALGVGQTATPTAGSRFGIYAVNSGGRLRLNPGIYYFDRLTVESGSTLELLNSTGPIQIYVRGPLYFRGTLVESVAKNNTLFGLAGRSDAPAEASLEVPFKGLVVAPFGQVTLSTTTVGHTGSFFAQRFEAHQATTIRHRRFDKEVFCEGVQECGGLCECVPEREPCTNSAHCQPGDTCPEQPNGARFGLPPEARVCEPIGCKDSARLLGCGELDAPCGLSCTDDIPCSASSPCPGSQVCGTDNGRLLGSAFDDVCWDPVCETAARASHCGGFEATCGVCTCTPACESPVCGQTNSDGCGGYCVGFCGEREPGCSSALDCAAGTVCIQNGGPRIGLPSGTNVCLPTRCKSLSPPPSDCGSVDAVCGVCPACVPRCEDRDCGLDPVCGQPCGTDCTNGTFCTDAGHCAANATTPPVSVPDGTGGTRVIEPLEPQATAEVGAVDGRFSVSESGAATYTIPILVPPGRAGVEPSLRLMYDGSRSNGDLGLGWRIDGLSSITLCSRTVALDGFVEPFDYAKGLNNAVCLDGKRLVQTGSGPGYIEYRTLIDSFARIVFINHDSQSRTSFLVYSKDGQILTYGANPDATLVSSSGAYTWGISRVEDRHGNYMSIRYEASDDGSVRSQDLTPGSITYTGLLNEPGNREVRFSYEERPDVLAGYRPGGAPFSKRRRLASIATYVRGEQLGRTYLLGYDPTLPALSQITSVTECSTTTAGSSCKQPTVFTYKRDTGFDIIPNIGVEPGAWVDFNGDGRQDILHTDVVVTDAYKPVREAVGGIIEAAAHYAHPAAGAATTLVYRGYLERELWPGPTIRASSSAHFAIADENFPYDSFEVPVSGLKCQGIAPGFILDFNGDKRDDVIEACSRAVIDRVLPPEHHVETNLQLALSRGDGTFEQAGTLFSLTNAKNFFTHDINGDGLDDILYCYGNLLAYRTRIAGGDFAAEQTTESYGTLCSDTPFRLQLDVDGNGTIELVVNKGHREDEADRELAALFAGPDGPFWTPVGRTVTIPWSDAVRVGDFNGDGLADILDMPRAWLPQGGPSFVFSARGSPIIWQNVGGRFEPRYPTGDGDVEVTPGLFVTDFDQDGRSDILYESGEDFGAQPRMKRFSASLDAATSTALSNTPLWSPIGGDSDADGVLDLFVPLIEVDQKLLESFLRPMYTKLLDEYQQWFVLRGRGRATNLLESVQDGLGKLTTIEYTSANVLDKTYTAGTSCDAREECVRRMPLLVSRHDERRGNETGWPQEHTAIYSYSDARIDRGGNGWLGFAQRTIKERDGAGNERTLVVDFGKRSERLMLAPSSNASYVYPYAGLATRYTLTSAAAAGELVQGGAVTRTSVTDVDWQVKQSASGRPFPYVNNRTTTVSDNGVPIVATQEHFEVDGYGNVTLNRTTQGADVTTTVTDFTPTPEQEASWLISLPKTESVTSLRNGLSVTREQKFDYDALGFVTSHTRAPGSARFEVVTTFTPDGFGNVAVVDVTAGGESRATAVGYDADGVFPATLTNAKLQTTQLRFDEANGGITVAADPNGIVTRRAYDGFGRLSVADGPAGQVAVDYFSAFPHPIAGPSGTGAWVASTFGMSVEAAGRRVETTFDRNRCIDPILKTDGNHGLDARATVTPAGS